MKRVLYILGLVYGAALFAEPIATHSGSGTLLGQPITWEVKWYDVGLDPAYPTRRILRMEGVANRDGTLHGMRVGTSSPTLLTNGLQAGYHAAVPGGLTTVNYYQVYVGGWYTAPGQPAEPMVIPVGVLLPWKVTFSKRNDKSYPVTYQLIQNGSVVGGVTLQPGQALIQQFELQSGDPVTIMALVEGITRDGAVWVEDPQGVTIQQVAPPVTPTQSDPPTVIPSSPDTPAVISNTPDPGVPNQSGQIVWQGNAGSSDLLTNGVFREGVSRLANAITSSASGGGEAVDVSGIESRLDTVNANLEALKEEEEIDEAPSEGVLQAALNAAKAQVESAWTSASSEWKQGLPTTGGGVGVGATSSEWPSFEVPRYGVVELNPYTKAPWLITLLNVGREILLWLLVVGFCKLRVWEIGEYAKTLAGAPQVQTSVAAQDLVPVGGQLLSWLKGSVSVIGILTVVSVTVGVAIGMVNTELGSLVGMTMDTVSGSTGGVTSALATLAGGSGGAAVRLMSELFPLDAILQLALAELVLSGLQIPLWVGAMLVVRAIRG